MDMIKIKRHGLMKEFARRFRDALFVLDANDKKTVEDAMKEHCSARYT